MTFGTKDGLPLTCCSRTVINKSMTGDGSVDPNDPTTGTDNKWNIFPGVPTFNANEGDYCIDSTTGEIWIYKNGQWVDTGKNVNTCVSGGSDDDSGGSDTDNTDTFLDAPTARLDATQVKIINDEITVIKNAILLAVKNNDFHATVSSSYMTDSLTGIPYFRVWKDLDPCCPLGYDARSITYQMDQVIKYFFDLKYVVERKQPTTDNNFNWYIYW